VSVGVGAVVTAWLVEVSGTRTALVVVGAVGPVLALAAWWRLARLDRTVTVRDADLELLRRVPMLQVLPLPSIEQLARGLEPVSVPAGQQVFGQGDEGDRYFVIESGEVEVVGDGAVVATLGPGEGFGEIALLRRVRRTATARARSDVRLQALSCDHFLPVVLGYTPSAYEAGVVVEGMLDRYSPKGPPGPLPPPV
jgi:CRP-like cAMP-binding protein